ncbi:Methyltransferase [Sulfitobacter noctilucae]|uniref:class I SAM-dependent methyltransferase n=1 Tax=Sulfitobacter noctilucae TaxID=1342302 RepID=UPI00046A9836|nr:class I SAM-dependent methyltransferase [Sulfitobacter noctilucae]KIN65421.1 Methyltransferase [Sulfitobacter noctilucae]
MDFSAFRDGERDGWSSRAEIYEDATARATLQSIPTLLSHARLFPDTRVLDAGCGPGYVAAAAKLLGAEAEGIDFSKGMVEQAIARFPAIQFAVADVENLPMADGVFDAVLSNFVLFHVTDPQLAMAEARRVLKTGGRFVFSQWLGPDRSECYKLLFDIIARHADMSRADPAPDPYVLSNADQVFKMMAEAGFKDTKSEIVENILHAPGPSFFDFFMSVGVRVPLILDRQDAEVRDIIRQEVDEAAARYLVDDCYRIPMPSIVFSGVAG